MQQDDYRLIIKMSLIEKTEKEIEEINAALDEKLDWIKIAGILLNHRLGGYFLFGLGEQQKRKVPKEIVKALELLSLGQTVRQKELNSEIEKISESLEKTDIRYAGLKGVIFGTEMYQIGMRRSNDIDILVYEEDLDKIDNVLRGLGYIETNNKTTMIEAAKREKVIQRMNYHDLVPYIKKIDDNLYIRSGFRTRDLYLDIAFVCPFCTYKKEPFGSLFYSFYITNIKNILCRFLCFC